MNKYIVYILSLILSTQAYAQCENEIILTVIGGGGGKKVRIYSIPDAYAKKLPKWTPGKPEPGIGVARAYALAKKRFIRNGALGKKTYQLANINFAHSSRGTENTWFYTVTFTESEIKHPHSGSGMSFSGSATLVVLLDGTVLTGKVMAEKEFYEKMRGY